MYDNGISLPSMAKRIGISQLSLRHFLTGKTEPYWITIGKIEKVLGKLDVTQLA
jgi:transcriptional regulator with XRE-family HTH domain